MQRGAWTRRGHDGGQCERVMHKDEECAKARRHCCQTQFYCCLSLQSPYIAVSDSDAPRPPIVPLLIQPVHAPLFRFSPFQRQCRMKTKEAPPTVGSEGLEPAVLPTTMSCITSICTHPCVLEYQYDKRVLKHSTAFCVFRKATSEGRRTPCGTSQSCRRGS